MHPGVEALLTNLCTIWTTDDAFDLLAAFATNASHFWRHVGIWVNAMLAKPLTTTITAAANLVAVVGNARFAQLCRAKFSEPVALQQ